MECFGKQIITTEDTGFITPYLAGGFLGATGLCPINDIVMKQGCGVKVFHHLCYPEGRFFNRFEQR